MKVTISAITKNPELEIERAARTCYNSLSNIQGEQVNGKFIQSLIKRGHTSVLEFASVTFNVSDVSRILLARLTRHRVGTRFAVESQRYVSQSNMEYATPLTIRNSEHILQYHALMDAVAEFYDELIESGIPKEDARFILPGAVTTSFRVTFNFRALRHFFELRLDSHAQWEIRKLALIMLKQIKAHAPNVFYDYIEKYL